MIIQKNNLLYMPNMATGLSQKEDIINGMTLINLSSMPFRAIDEIVIQICKSSEITKKSCGIVAEAIDKIAKIVPENFKNQIELTKKYFNQSLSLGFKKEFDIPEDETLYFIESAKYILEGFLLSRATGAIKNGVKRAIRQSKDIINYHTLKKSPKLSEYRFIELSREGNEALLDMNLFKEKNGILKIWIRGLWTINKKTDHLYEVGSTPTSGITFAALKAIKEIAKEKNAKEIYLQWSPANKNLLNVAKKSKRFQYLGDKPSFLKINKIFPVFKMEIDKKLAFKPNDNYKYNFGSRIVLKDIYQNRESFINDEKKNLDVQDLFSNVSLSEFFNNEKNKIALLTKTSQNTSLQNFKIEEVGEKFIEIVGDLTGINPIINEAKEFKSMANNISINPEDAPKLLIEKIFNAPKQMLTRVINTPKEFGTNFEKFLINPSFSEAFNILGTTFSVISIANEILPILNRLISNPVKAPLLIPKELLNCTISKIIGVVKLGKEFINDPFKTSVSVIKDIIYSPKKFIFNVKSLFRIGRKKKKHHKRRKAIQNLQNQRNFKNFVQWFDNHVEYVKWFEVINGVGSWALSLKIAEEEFQKNSISLNAPERWAIVNHQISDYENFINNKKIFEPFLNWFKMHESQIQWFELINGEESWHTSLKIIEEEHNKNSTLLNASERWSLVSKQIASYENFINDPSIFEYLVSWFDRHAAQAIWFDLINGKGAWKECLKITEEELQKKSTFLQAPTRWIKAFESILNYENFIQDTKLFENFVRWFDRHVAQAIWFDLINGKGAWKECLKITEEELKKKSTFLQAPTRWIKAFENISNYENFIQDTKLFENLVRWFDRHAAQAIWFDLINGKGAWKECLKITEEELQKKSTFLQAPTRWIKAFENISNYENFIQDTKLFENLVRWFDRHATQAIWFDLINGKDAWKDCLKITKEELQKKSTFLQAPTRWLSISKQVSDYENFIQDTKIFEQLVLWFERNKAQAKWFDLRNGEGAWNKCLKIAEEELQKKSTFLQAPTRWLSISKQVSDYENFYLK